MAVHLAKGARDFLPAQMRNRMHVMNTVRGVFERFGFEPLGTPAFERIVLPFKRNLERLGIDVSVRLVDQSQYINRVRQFDFDVIISGWGQSESPGNEQRDYWGSDAAARPGSRNYIGIAEPAIDALIELLIEAPDRQSLVARTRALDRTLLAGHWVVPNWHITAQRILYWDKFGRPEVTPYHGVVVNSWWYDETKAKRLRPLAERLITFAKRGDLHARRRVMTIIRDKSAVHELFTEIAPLMAEREGGYTRITKVGYRKGDNAPMAVIELVLEPVNPKPKSAKKATAAAAPAEAPVVDEVVADDAAADEVVANEVSTDEAIADETVGQAPAADAADEASADEASADEAEAK